jgi:VanZ family protein
MPTAGRSLGTGWPRLKPVLLYWCPLFCYAAAIFYLSSLSHPEDLLPVTIWDKAAHVVEYTVLGILSCRALTQASPLGRSSRAMVWAMFGAALYGVTDEVHQTFVASRQAEILDVFADAIGASVGAMTWKYIGFN